MINVRFTFHTDTANNLSINKYCPERSIFALILFHHL